MSADTPKFSDEELMLVDQLVRNAGLLTECTRHPQSFYKTWNRLDTLNRIDAYLMTKQDRLLTGMGRTEVQLKGLMLVVLRKYPERCQKCAG